VSGWFLRVAQPSHLAIWNFVPRVPKQGNGYASTMFEFLRFFDYRVKSLVQGSGKSNINSTISR